MRWAQAIDALSPKWNRTGSAIAILGASALTGWVDQLVAHLVGFRLEQTTPWIGFAVMLVGVAMLAYGAGKANPTPNPNDVELYDSFKEVFSDGVRNFLEEHSFGNDFGRDDLAGVFAFPATWRGTRYDFQDDELDTALDFVKNRASEFNIKIGEYTGMADYNVNFQTVKTTDDRLRGMSRETLAHIDELNEISTQLVKAIDQVDEIARRKLT
jgi:hypothetical protein